MLIEHLRKEFAERTLKNPRYSLRAYAKSLNTDASTLSALLRKKRPLTAKSAKKLIEALDLDPVERNRIYSSYYGGEATTPVIFSELDLEAFEVISSWEHFAILALLEISTPQPDLKWISRSLGIQMSSALEALERLEKLQLVRRTLNQWSLTGRNLSTPSNVPSAALRKNNRQYIEMAAQSLELDPVHERDITGMTMAIDRRKLPQAQKLIKEFRRSLAAYLESGEKNAVYRLGIQLYPLSRNKSGL